MVFEGPRWGHLEHGSSYWRLLSKENWPKETFWSESALRAKRWAEEVEWEAWGQRGSNGKSPWKAKDSKRGHGTGVEEGRWNGTGRLQKEEGQHLWRRLRRHRRQCRGKTGPRAPTQSWQWNQPQGNSRKGHLMGKQVSSSSCSTGIIISWVVFQLAHVRIWHIYLSKAGSRHNVSIIYLFVLTKNAQCFWLFVLTL